MTDARRFLPVVLTLVAASVIFCLPLFENPDQTGRQDWDQFTFRYETPRLAMVRDYEVPAWNPYARGGTVLLAHPDSPALSPWYAIVLFLGAPFGLRVQVLVFMMLGSVGMAVLVRTLGASRIGAVAGGMAFMMSSHFVLHMTEGHLEWCVLGLMPWMFVLLARQSVRSAIGAAFLLASVLMFGSVYVPAMFLPALSLWVLLESIKQRRVVLMGRWVAVGIIAVLLAGPKLLPVIDFVTTHPRPAEIDPDAPWSLMPVMFGDPRQDKYYQAFRDRRLEPGHFAKTLTDEEAQPFLATMKQAGIGFNFHEFGCYIGIAGIVLALIGFGTSFRRLWPFYLTGALAFLAVFGSNAPVNLWSWMQQLPFYGQLHVPSRFLMVVVLVLAVAVAFGATAVSRWSRLNGKWRLALAAVLVAGMYLELSALGWRLLGDVFIVPPIDRTHHATFAHRCDESSRVDDRVTDSNMMACLNSNSGDLAAYENMTVPTGRVILEGAPGYRGEAYLERATSGAVIANWTMSRIAVTVTATAPDRLVLNQNFDDGWHASIHRADGTTRESPAEATADGLISIPVDTATARVEFRYVVPGFRTGLWLFAPAFLLCVVGLIRDRVRNRQVAAPAGTPSAPR